MNVVKSSIIKYDVTETQTDPFSFVIDDKKGSINIQYCYGSCGSIWNSPGECMKKFLLRCDNYYISKNFFGAANYLDWDETQKNMLKTIVKRRKWTEKYLDQLDEEEARDSYDHVSSMEATSFDGLMHQIPQIPNYEEIWGVEYYLGLEESVTTLHPNHNFFMNKIWPLIRSIIKDELENKKFPGPNPVAGFL